MIHGRPVRYAAASLVALLLAQGGLVVAYGLFKWGVAPAVAFSLVVSVVPSYALNRRCVWRERAGGGTGPLLGFFGLAITGSAAIAVIGSVTEHLTRPLAADRRLLTLCLGLASIATTTGIWGGRYVLLDRFVFPPGRRIPAG